MGTPYNAPINYNAPIPYNGAVAPVAEFSGAPLSGDVPLAVTFTDLSTGSPTSWTWTFGDGGTSTEQSPTHVYTVAGTYDVSLTATNAGGSDSETKTGYVMASGVVAIGGRPLSEASGGTGGYLLPTEFMATNYKRGASSPPSSVPSPFFPDPVVADDSMEREAAVVRLRKRRAVAVALTMMED